VLFPEAEITWDDESALAAVAEAGAVTAVEYSCAVLAAALVGVGELVRPATHVLGGGFTCDTPCVAHGHRSAPSLHCSSCATNFSIATSRSCVVGTAADGV
jgi:hypothetical protein